MSWQPMMYIPRATRMRGRTWLVAAFSPAVALLIAYLVTLLSLALGPSPEQLAQAAGEEIPPLSTVLPGLVDGVPSTAVSALILTLLGLAAPMSMTIKLVASLWIPALFPTISVDSPTHTHPCHGAGDIPPAPQGMSRDFTIRLDGVTPSVAIGRGLCRHCGSCILVHHAQHERLSTTSFNAWRRLRA